MYVDWRRQVALDDSRKAERLAARVEREVIFYRAGYSATIPAWALTIADNRSIRPDQLRVVLAEAYLEAYVS